MSDDKRPTDPLLEQQREAQRVHFLGSLGDLLDARRKRKAECPTLPPSAPRGQKPGGYTLVEVLLVLAAMSAMAAAGWLLFGPTSVAADVKQTQMDFSETATAIDRSLGIVGGFSGLSTSLVRTDGLAAQRLRHSDGLRNAWGGSVSFLPNTVKHGNDSFLVETRDVPKAACAKLVAAMAGDPAVADAQVNGESVYVNNKYDPASAAVACEQHGGDRLGFVYFSGLASGSSVAVSSIALPTAPPSVNPTNPATPVAPVNGAPSVGDAVPGTPGVVTPGTPSAPPPAVPTAPPAPATPTTPPPTPGVLPPSTPKVLPVCTVPRRNLKTWVAQLAKWASTGSNERAIAARWAGLTRPGPRGPMDRGRLFPAHARPRAWLRRLPPWPSPATRRPNAKTSVARLARWASTGSSAAASRTARAPRPGCARPPPARRCRARRIAGAAPTRLPAGGGLHPTTAPRRGWWLPRDSSICLWPMPTEPWATAR